MAEKKTFQGDFWYIQVGPSYFTGMKPVMTTGTRNVVDTYAMEARKERLKKVPKYVRENSSRNIRIYKNGTRSIQWVRGNNEPIMTSEVVAVPSGNFIEGWSTELKDAKPFRLRSKAVAKAEEIAKSLNMDKVRPQVLLHEEMKK